MHQGIFNISTWKWNTSGYSKACIPNSGNQDIGLSEKPIELIKFIWQNNWEFNYSDQSCDDILVIDIGYISKTAHRKCTSNWESGVDVGSCSLFYICLHKCNVV